VKIISCVESGMFQKESNCYTKLGKIAVEESIEDRKGRFYSSLLKFRITTDRILACSCLPLGRTDRQSA